jgi:integrase
VLRLFNPDDQSGPVASLHWTVADFFECWYLPSVREDPKRRPPAQATIDRRQAAVDWWSRLMGSAAMPDGPSLASITAKDLETFRERLKTATYKRGLSGLPRPLSEWTQYRTLEEIQQLLNAAGPSSGRNRRAEILDRVPGIYAEAPPAWPKETWSIEEARQLSSFVGSMDSHRAGLSVNQYRLLAEGTIALWYYTGHRATTYEHLSFDDLVELRSGAWCLQVRRSVKTGKADRLRVHPQLLERLLRIKQTFGAGPLLPWPVAYRCVSDYHDQWQEAAGLQANRRFRPQAWRRLHGSAIAAGGYESARGLAASALGHSSAAITESHYTAVRDLAILNLPPLF